MPVSRSEGSLEIGGKFEDLSAAPQNPTTSEEHPPKTMASKQAENTSSRLTAAVPNFRTFRHIIMSSFFS
eukprot:scaffold14392_cov151-Skeletonema_menzelii.AAC.2